MDQPTPGHTLAHSLRLQGPDGEFQDDLYVCQAPLLYNQREVYVGHTYGHYLYYYKPDPTDKKETVEGWCIAEYLGSGEPNFRLALGPTVCDSRPCRGVAQCVVQCWFWGLL